MGFPKETPADFSQEEVTDRTRKEWMIIQFRKGNYSILSALSKRPTKHWKEQCSHHALSCNFLVTLCKSHFHFFTPPVLESKYSNNHRSWFKKCIWTVKRLWKKPTQGSKVDAIRFFKTKVHYTISITLSNFAYKGSIISILLSITLQLPSRHMSPSTTTLILLVLYPTAHPSEMH